jgi:hypothetical protein
MSEDGAAAQLLAVFERLDAGGRALLAEFAGFLLTRHAAPAPAPEKTPYEPAVVLPRPERESVIGALKRLTASYPMLNKSLLLDETSPFLTQHMVEGRAAVEVIDELEAVFLRHYTLFCQGKGRNP